MSPYLQLFRDFSVASGRATFKIPGEFEVDLSLGDDEPSSQLYFVEFRFNFSPSVSTLPAGMLRSDLEVRANDALRLEGLQGLFNLLHNPGFDTQINYPKGPGLRARAKLLVRASHGGAGRDRSSCIIGQTGQGQKLDRSWSKARKEERIKGTHTRQKISKIGVRCFRAGKEVHDLDLHLNLGELSIDLILKQVIARHSSYIFDTIVTRLLDGFLYSSGCLTIKVQASDAEPSDVSLLVQLAATTAIKIVQEPVTGRFAVQPSSYLNSRAEYELNRLPTPMAEAAPQLAYLRSLVSVDEVEASARKIGWESVKSLSPVKEEMQKHFPKSTLQTRFFRRQEWASIWILAFTTSSEGDTWWIVELSKRTSTSKGSRRQGFSDQPIKAAYNVLSKTQEPFVFSASTQTLAQIEWTAAGMIAQHSNAREIGDDSRHNILVSSTGVPTLTMLVHMPKSSRLPATTKPSLPDLREKLNNSGRHETVRLLYKGLDAATRSAVHVAIARISKPIARFRDIASQIPNLDIARLPIDGAPIRGTTIEVDVYKFMLLSKVGESCIPQLITRLAAIERLLDHVSVLESKDLAINSASLSHINFTYASSPKDLESDHRLITGCAFSFVLSESKPAPSNPRLSDLVALERRSHTGISTPSNDSAHTQRSHGC